MSSFTNTGQSKGFVLKSNTSSFGASKPMSNKITLSASSFESWRAYIYELCGIYFQDNKKYLLESRLLKRITHLKLL